MPDMRETLKYTFTVEGETEQWYLLWLRDQINACPDRDKNISIVPKVQQSPAKFYKKHLQESNPCRDAHLRCGKQRAGTRLKVPNHPV